MTALVDRVRMALAEAGYPAASVLPLGESVVIDFSVPGPVAWRAGMVAGAPTTEGDPACCLECFMFANTTGCASLSIAERGWDCAARGVGIEDCGVERVACR